MRVAIAGSGRLGTGIFHAVGKSRHVLVAVLQNGRTVQGMARRLAPWLTGGAHPRLPAEAARAKVPLLWIDRMSEGEIAPLRALKPDLLLVAGFSIILREELLALPRVGCVNVHSSLLPKHRGPNPFSAVILCDERESGVTFHIMEPSIDTGDILDQTAFPLTRDETQVSVYLKSCQLAAERVVPVLDRIESEGLCGIRQDAALATYDKKTSHTEARIDWERPAIEIDRLVRALGPPTEAYFPYRGREIRVYATHYSETPVAAAAGTVLANRPYVEVATGLGSVRLRYARTPRLGWRWPTPLHRPPVGARLE